MNKVQVTVMIALLLCAGARGQDEFSGIKCGTDIPRALIGKRFVNGRVVVIEAAHKNIGLEDLGGTEISERLFLISWRICGAEYQLLENTRSRMIRDVLAFPTHSRSFPEAIGGCQINGKDSPDAIVAVLDNSDGYDVMHSSRLLNAISAWKIDETHERFQQLTASRVACPAQTVVTLDGGP
jgi:hypothetical protein